jgi:hypothetical protein
MAELATGHPFLTGDSEIGQLMAIFSVLGRFNHACRFCQTIHF